MIGSVDLPRWQVEQVRSALKLIAADLPAQIAHLDGLGTGASLDELALEFDDVRGLIPGLVRRGDVPQELERVAAGIEATMRAMAGRQELWLREALDRPEWHSVRKLGQHALRLVERGAE